MSLVPYYTAVYASNSRALKLAGSCHTRSNWVKHSAYPSRPTPCECLWSVEHDSRLSSTTVDRVVLSLEIMFPGSAPRVFFACAMVWLHNTHFAIAVCLPGQYDSEGGPCRMCPIGKYSNSDSICYGVAACNQTVTGGEAQFQLDALANCCHCTGTDCASTVQLSTTEAHATCSACPPGSYSDAPGAVICTLCKAGTQDSQIAAASHLSATWRIIITAVHGGGDRVELTEAAFVSSPDHSISCCKASAELFQRWFTSMYGLKLPSRMIRTESRELADA